VKSEKKETLYIYQLSTVSRRNKRLRAINQTTDGDREAES